ncbi:MAG TPA: PEGA domain-containing protein, partial [Myxococcus sp.]|nr:PEGA domain-containing protein [Myxococcus sp.]
AEAARLAYEAEQAVARSGRLTLVRLVDALAGREGEAKAAEAALAVREGQLAYDELDTQKALQQFDKAVRAYEASDLSRHFGELIRARVMKAASQVANGEDTAAQLEIRALLSVEPRAQFSPNFFPPEQMAFIEKERKAALAAPRASLRVSTEPVPAQVYVDGQFRGVSPVELPDVAAADHYVTAVAPGYAVAQRRAREGGVALTLEPVPARQSLQLLTERVARKPDGKERDMALRELGALAGVSQVLALLVRGGTGSAPLDVTALRLDVGDGHSLAYAPGTVPRGGGMAVGAPALLEPLVSADAPRQDGKPVTHFAGGGGARRTLGYVLMATGVALVAGGVYFGLEASAKQDEFKRTPQTSPRATELRDTGKRYALIADAGILAGVVSAGLGTYFAFSGGGGSAAPSRASRATPVPAPKTEEPRGEALPMPPPPKATKPAGEALPMPPPPSRTAPAAQPAAPPAAEPPAPAKPADSRRARAEEERKRREAEEQRKQEEAAAKRREEEEAKRRQEAEAKRREEEEKRKREEAEARRKREEEERRRREEEEKKKRPALDEDDLRNY